MRSSFCFAFLLVFQFIIAQKPNIEDGSFKNYYESGELKREGAYLNGEPDGKWIRYYKNGQVSQEFSYKEGRYDKTSRKDYYENGIVEYEVINEDSYFVGVGYYESGNIKYKRKLDEGFYREYNEKGLLKIEANYYKSDLYGLWKSFYDNGNIAWQVTYLNGYRNGGYKQFYKNGKLKLAGVFIKDKKNGEEKRYSSEGNLEWKGAYSNDEFDKVWTQYDPSGKKIQKVKFKNGIPIEASQKDILVGTLVPDGVMEKVPVYPGCENEIGNTLRKRCMSNAIAKFVNKKFNTRLPKKLGLSGRYRILVIFKIGKDGQVFDVDARASHPELQKEAIRVVNQIPKFQPGYQHGKPVVVPYSLPILFQL